MSQVDDSALRRGANGRALYAWERLRGTLSVTFPRRLRDTNRLAGNVLNDPRLRKRGR